MNHRLNNKNIFIIINSTAVTKHMSKMGIPILVFEGQRERQMVLLVVKFLFTYLLSCSVPITSCSVPITCFISYSIPVTCSMYIHIYLILLIYLLLDHRKFMNCKYWLLLPPPLPIREKSKDVFSQCLGATEPELLQTFNINIFLSLLFT